MAALDFLGHVPCWVIGGGARVSVQLYVSCRGTLTAPDPLRPKDRFRGSSSNARFPFLPEHADQWPAIFPLVHRVHPRRARLPVVRLVRSLDDPHEYVLVEAFRDADAGGAHVQSEHFRAAREELPPYLAETPRIINFEVPGTEWSELGELAVDRS